MLEHLYKLHLYKLYQYTPKRLREQRELVETLGETVNKPGRANGTRWVPFKRRPRVTLTNSFYVIIGYMGELSGGFVNERRTQSENKELLTKMKNFQFVA